MVIIATLAGMTTLSIGSASSRKWNGEVQRLAHLLQLVADRALIDKTHYGVLLEEEAYRVVRYDPLASQWSEIDFSSDTAGAVNHRFAAHALPPNMHLEVLEQTELPGADETEAGADDLENIDEEGNDGEDGPQRAPTPQFAALSSGEVLPVEVAMHLMKGRDISRSAIISYSSLYGMQLEWLVDDDR
ncbi:MAG: general secretion pathway protein GspH [Gammaproteobacteria bacterium]|nr:general secretion pathway protein GspH [Gammaproteobacteria bacterium]